MFISPLGVSEGEGVSERGGGSGGAGKLEGEEENSFEGVLQTQGRKQAAIMTSWQPTASNVQTKSLGMTAPINTEEPKPADIELTLALEVID